jgi:NAD(P)-dependent dehydrogenase (short-subunit alcohol dehydrogenase family)
MNDFTGRTAVVTGGASGIGLGMARAFAARGMNLVLADLDAALLAEAESEFSKADVPVVTQLCDVSRLEDVEQLAELTTCRLQ